MGDNLTEPKVVEAMASADVKIVELILRWRRRLRIIAIVPFGIATLVGIGAIRRFLLVKQAASILAKFDVDLGSPLLLAFHQVERSKEYTSFGVWALSMAHALLDMTVLSCICLVCGLTCLAIHWSLGKELEHLEVRPNK